VHRADLLDQTKELRQKLYMLEALLQIEKGRRTKEWFEGKAPEDHERPEAVKRLLETGLIEAEPSQATSAWRRGENLSLERQSQNR